MFIISLFREGKSNPYGLIKYPTFINFVARISQKNMITWQLPYFTDLLFLPHFSKKNTPTFIQAPTIIRIRVIFQTLRLFQPLLLFDK